MNNAIPRAQSPLVDRAGHPTREWYSFFLSALEAADGDSNVEEQIRAIIVRLAALEGSSPLNFQLLGLDSVIVTGTPQNGHVQINLDGDTGDPGGTYFYGTGPDGAKGWLLLGDALVAEPGELAVVIGRDAKNVSEADAMSHVLGYAASNDVTARYYQLPDNSGGQFCYAKSFDGFAPLGDAIVPPPAGGGPSRITTRVNGELRQESSTDDLIFGVASIVSHLSRGTTLRRGTVIMTGTPAGVGYFRNEFLKDGDVVEVEIEGVGKVKNAMRFEKS